PPPPPPGMLAMMINIVFIDISPSSKPDKSHFDASLGSVRDVLIQPYENKDKICLAGKMLFKEYEHLHLHLGEFEMDTLRIISKKNDYEIFDTTERMTIVKGIETYQTALILQRKLMKLKQDAAAYSMRPTQRRA
ncbi:MAG: hypothetical protein H7839_22910, partial [Magnetococcus sp. YQC-5]